MKLKWERNLWYKPDFYIIIYKLIGLLNEVKFLQDPSVISKKYPEL